MTPTFLRNRNQSPLSDDQIRAIAPSVFAQEPWHAMSDRYAFIPTIDVVARLRREGFEPYSVQQSRSRIPGKADFTRHALRFRREGAAELTHLGQLFPELLLTNAHDGSNGYQLDAAIFRLLCMNGLVTQDSAIEHIKVRHVGGKSVADAVIEASYQIVDQFPRVLDSVQEYSTRRLEPALREAFALGAIEARYGSDEPAPVTPKQILAPRRTADAKDDLWTTYNVIQENITQGGQWHQERSKSGKRLRTRAITGIQEDTKINKLLWNFTERINAALKAQAA